MVDKVSFSWGTQESSIQWFIPAQDTYNVPLTENFRSTSNSLSINTSTYPYLNFDVFSIPVINDDTTNSTVNLVWVSTNTGYAQPYVSSSALTWNPATATLTASNFVGNINGVSTDAKNIYVTDDNTTLGWMPLTWVTSTDDYLPVYTSSVELMWNPSEQILAAPNLSGNLSTIATNALATYYIPIINGSSTAHYTYYVGSGLTFNPALNTLSTTNVIATNAPISGNYCVNKTYDDARWIDIVRQGFVNNSQTTIGFDPVTYTFTITDTGSGWQYMWEGIVYTITGNKTITLSGTPPTAQTYFIYIDNDTGTLGVMTTPYTLLDTKLPVAIIYWNNALTPKYWLSDERHQCLIDSRQHYYEHFTLGTRYLNGGIPSGYVVAPFSPTNADNVFAISQAQIADEDLIITCPGISKPSGSTPAYEIFYRSGASTWLWQENNVPFYYTVGGYINWDNGGTMTQGSSANYYNSYLIYTHISGVACFIIISGRGEFGSLAAAQAENIATFNLAAIGILEAVAAYQFTWRSLAGYGTLGKVRLAATPVQLNISYIATGSGGAITNATSVTLNDDTTSNASMDLIWATGTNGQYPLFTSSSGLNFNPSTNILTATGGLTTSGNLSLPTTTSSVGQIKWNGVTYIHTAGTSNLFIGDGINNYSNTGSNNIGIGTQTLISLTSGIQNTTLGQVVGYSLTTGSYNLMAGVNAGYYLTTGNYNTFLGVNAGFNYTSSESSNVLIANRGVLGESNVIRIGRPGSGNQEQNLCYIAGIYNTATAGGTKNIVLVDNGHQLGGTDTIPSAILGNSSLYIGTTAVALNAASGSVTSISVNLTGNVTGNCSGSSGSCTGNAATATYLAGGAANQIPYQTAASTTAFMTASSYSVVNTDSKGVPSLSATPSFNTLTLLGTTDSSSTITGSFITAGGVGIAKKIYVGTDAHVAGVTYADSTTEATTGGAGSLVSAGGLYATKAIINGSTTDSSSTTTGALITAGGAAIAKKLYVGTGIYLPTSGGTPSELNFNEDFAHTTTLHGIWAADQNITFNLSRVGKVVVLSIPSVTATANTVATITMVDAFPARFRPSTSLYQVVYIYDNGGYKVGAAIITTGGALTLYNGNFNNFTGSGTSGTAACALSWKVS